MAKERSCAERLPEHRDSRLADIRAMLSRDDIDAGDDELPGLFDYGLGVSESVEVRIDLSTGGPADYITATVRDGEVIAAEYHFADWFDHAADTLTGDDLATVERYIDTLYGGELPRVRHDA